MLQSLDSKLKMEDKQKVLVLGVHDGHNAGASLILNGKVIAAINEERLNNIKNYSGVPTQSIKKVFEISKLSPKDVSLITISSFLRLDDPLKMEGNKIHFLSETFGRYLHQKWFVRSSVKFFYLFRKKQELFDLFENMGIGKKPVRFIEHHLSHAASAFYQRPWDERTLILTLDGMGDGLSATVSIGDKFKIKRIAETSYYDSIGNNLYSEVTAYLGMKRWEHEYKVMGLAPFGKAELVIEDLRKTIRINPEKPLEFENISGHYLKKMQNVYKKILAYKRFDNIAAATQKIFEDLVLEWIKNCVKETRIYKVVFSGGSFLNVKLNKLIGEMDIIEDVFFYPACDDGGSAVGAALEGYYRYCEENKIKASKTILSDIYYGQEFTEQEIVDFLKRKKLLKKARKLSEKEIAKYLKAGKVIARFSGRDEWGPRALGNRSILADPRNLSIVRKINQAIKQRDFWMPFAPAILKEDQQKYIKNNKFSPYMIEAFDTKPLGKDLIAALHPYDLSARPQSVNEWNPEFEKIIKEFKKITGVSGLLNTSFNLHGFPVCGTLETAYLTFRNSDLDGLLLGNWFIEK